MFLADISVQSAGWVDFFLLLAVFVAIIGLVICLLGLPIAPVEYRFLWVLLFVWCGFTAAGLLFQ
jgi:hypothetical protein